MSRHITWVPQFSDMLKSAIGIRFEDAQAWSNSEADFVCWTDASNIGLSFVYASNGFCYRGAHKELLAILSGLHHIASKPSPPKRVLFFSDSLDSVQVLSSFAVKESSHNSILLAIAGIVLKTGIDIRVRHMTGKDNLKADLLSRLLLDDFKLQFPSYRVRTFEPPRELLPAQWRESF
ncbi:hypothetical protein EV360DRAFT_90425 [Lentinula raphanica]|nr:hypothetical protein EV360DRAFT_90425 [Lentinula raphanica]